jgi:hypothetical protein
MDQEKKAHPLVFIKNVIIVEEPDGWNTGKSSTPVNKLLGSRHYFTFVPSFSANHAISRIMFLPYYRA